MPKRHSATTNPRVAAQIGSVAYIRDETHKLLGFMLPIFIATSLLCTQAPANDQVDFENDIAPILQVHCIRCHYPGNEQGDISLATARDLQEFEFLSPGDPDQSFLIDLVSGEG
ncbi:MAG: c-type cytochrome domain-containing protein, partial [Planctomycetota bacterium]